VGKTGFRPNAKARNHFDRGLLGVLKSYFAEREGFEHLLGIFKLLEKFIRRNNELSFLPDWI